MCAINGFNFLNRELIEKMNLANHHRGPDASDIFIEEGISLGHNRLSVIDLSEKAAQPMKSFDEREVIVFNGEIYNFQELKDELKNFYPFKSESDTEMILAAYRKWGGDCVKKFNGIFAFAIWDRARREIFLARDHIGVKPLYYYLSGGKFIFSSEIKSILEHEIPRRLNLEAFNHYLRVLYVPEPLTMFDGIYKFPQASRGFYKDGKLNIEKYWDIGPGNYLSISGTHIKEELRNRIQQAVKAQLLSDRPLGLYLSGGVDSSVILYHMSKMRDGVDTFSVGFELSKEEQKEKFNADFELAKKTSAFFGSTHHEVLIKPAEVFELLEKAVWHMDEPISNPTAVSMLKLSKFSKEKVDVVLAGDGGDELFGGYERYRLSLWANFFQKLPVFLRRPLNFSPRFKKLNTPADIERFALFMFQKDDILKKAVSADYFNSGITKLFFEKKYFDGTSEGKKFSAGGGPFCGWEEILMNVDRQTWLVDFALTLGDKMSMANGIEARVPFLDKDLTEFAAAIPLKYKVSLFNTKKILKSSYRGRIPDFLLNQPKRGWFSPGAKWLRMDQVRNKAREALSETYYSETRNLFNWPELETVFDRHISGREYNLTILWAIVTFQIWAKKYNIRV
jgi:asparagine synthase (glutamine-hydrolysing)